MAILALAAGLTQAATVNYTVSGLGPTNYPGWLNPQNLNPGPEGAPGDPIPPDAPHLTDGFGYPGDCVTFDPWSGSLNITVTGLGQHQSFPNQKIGTLKWTVNFTYNGTDDCVSNDGPPPKDWPELRFAILAPRNMTVDGASGSISQGGLLRTNWDWDYLGLASGSMVTFLTTNYKIDVTPLSLPEVKMNNWSGDPPWIQNSRNVLANFEVTVIPEPLTMLGVALGLGSVGAYIRRRRMV